LKRISEGRATDLEEDDGTWAIPRPRFTHA
jgi:hypothetical protein